jgi:diacylglycerol kinase
MYKRYLRRFPHAIRGLRYAANKDFGYRTQLYGVGLLVIIILFWLAPLSQSEVFFMFLAYALILITELQNSALEVALDKLHPELHGAIGLSKDMAAGAVLTAGLFLLLVIGGLIYERAGEIFFFLQ